jgi:hypothetical protein
MDRTTKNTGNSTYDLSNIRGKAIALADLDNNRYIDIVAVSEESLKVYMNDNGSLSLDWWVLPPKDDVFTGLPAIGHIQLEGIPELDVVISSYDPTSSDYIRFQTFDCDGDKIKEWKSSVKHNYNPRPPLKAPSIENVYNSGRDEVVASYAIPRKTEIFNPWSVSPQAVLDYGNWWSTPALFDVNDDNHPDILSVTMAGSSILHAYDTWNDEEVWSTSSASGTPISSPAVGDISSGISSETEIAYGLGGQNKMRLIRHPNGYDVEDWPLTLSAASWTSPALARLEGPFDINSDIIFGMDNEWLFAVNQSQDQVYPFPLKLFGIPNSVVVGDIDGDGKSQIVLSSRDGYLHVWDNSLSWIVSNTLEWPQFHHDYQHTGVYGWVGGLRGGTASPREFNTGTTISFELEDTLRISVEIFDTQGNAVKALVDQLLPKGSYHPVWNGTNYNNVALPNGVYFIELRVNDMSKIISVKINR